MTEPKPRTDVSSDLVAALGAILGDALLTGDERAARSRDSWSRSALPGAGVDAAAEEEGQGGFE